MCRSILAKAVLVCFLLSGSCLSQQLSKRMTNQDVIDMVSLGLSDEVIMEKLRSSNGSDFDTSVPALRALKAANVSDVVIRVMINPTLALAPARFSTGTQPKASTTDTSLVPEPGVYAIHNDRPAEVPPEIVNWQTGGVAKSTFSLGIVKGDKNGKVARATSPTQLSTPIEFLIRTPEGTSVEEYQLLRLHRKGDRREFRSVTGGVLHVSGGAQRDDLTFQPEKIGLRTWRISLPDLTNGEYGFLPPGMESASISASGKMFTFSVVDGQSSSPSTHAPHADGTSSKVGSASGFAGQGTMGASSGGNPTIRHNGVTLSSVVPGGAADRAGIRAGDIILAINDHYLFTAQEMSQEIRRYNPGTEIAIRYLRYSTIYETSLVLESAQ